MRPPLSETDYPLEGFGVAGPSESALRRLVPRRVHEFVGRALRSVERWKGRPRGASVEGDRLPFVATFSPKPDSRPVRVEDHPGLLFAEPAVPDGSVPGAVEQLRTVWRDRDSFLAGLPDFQRAVNLPDPTWTGFHRGTRSRRARWWRRAPWGLAFGLLGLAAGTLGNLEKVNDARGWLVGPATFELTNPRVPVDVMVGRHFEVKAQARNTLGTPGTCDFEFQWADSEFVRGNGVAGGIEIDCLPAHRLSSVREGGETQVTISGLARRPGLYEIRLYGTAAAGVFRGDPVPFDGVVARVRVWDAFSFGERTVDDRCDRSKRCWARFELAAGRDWDEVVVQATLDTPRNGQTDLSILGVTYPGAGEPTKYLTGGPGSPCRSIKFSTPRLAAMRVESFVLLLESRAAALEKDKWLEIVRDMQLEHDYPPKKKREP